MTELINFDLPKNKSSIIKVIGVGGGGSNAVNYMHSLGIEGVDFMICNTDKQALEQSMIPNKIQIGVQITEGLGAGSKPEVGKDSAIENIEQVKEILKSNTKMVFITAGMGGGTGTGAAPVIAAAAKEMGILTVGIVTLPFSFEGRKRKQNAEEGIKELKDNVDTLLIICNDRLREVYGNLSIRNAFGKADDVLCTAAKGMAEIVTKPGLINVDFNDVNTIMSNGGSAIMGYATASGENRAIRAIEEALASPLLNDNDIRGAQQILVNITCSSQSEISMDEVAEITDYIYEQAGEPENVIPGVVFDDSLGENISVIVIATNLEENKINAALPRLNKKVHELRDTKKEEVIKTQNNEEEFQLRRINPTIEKKEDDIVVDNNKIKSLLYNNIHLELTNRESVNTNSEITLNKVIETITLNENIEAVNEVVFNEEPVSETVVNEETINEEISLEISNEEIVFENESTIESIDTSDFESKEIKAVENNFSSFSFVEANNKLNISKTVYADPEPKTDDKKDTIDELDIKIIKKESVANDENDANKLNDERKKILKQMSFNLIDIDNSDNLKELEDVPAFIRKKINLEQTPHSSESQVSRFSLNEGNDKKVELRENNSFLHDNVD